MPGQELNNWLVGWVVAMAYLAVTPPAIRAVGIAAAFAAGGIYVFYRLGASLIDGDD